MSAYAAMNKKKRQTVKETSLKKDQCKLEIPSGSDWIRKASSA